MTFIAFWLIIQLPATRMAGPGLRGERKPFECSAVEGGLKKCLSNRSGRLFVCFQYRLYNGR